MSVLLQIKRAIKNEMCPNQMGWAEKSSLLYGCCFFPRGLRFAIDHAPFLGSHGMQKTDLAIVDISQFYPLSHSLLLRGLDLG